MHAFIHGCNWSKIKITNTSSHLHYCGGYGYGQFENRFKYGDCRNSFKRDLSIKSLKCVVWKMEPFGRIQKYKSQGLLELSAL